VRALSSDWDKPNVSTSVKMASINEILTLYALQLLLILAVIRRRKRQQARKK